MLKIDFKKYFRRTGGSKGSDPQKMEITPYRDWRILVGVFFLGVIVSFGFNIFMSMQISSDSFFTADKKSNSGVVLNKDGLSKTLDELAAKEAAFEKARTETISVVDPSL